MMQHIKIDRLHTKCFTFYSSLIAMMTPMRFFENIFCRLMCLVFLSMDSVDGDCNKPTICVLSDKNHVDFANWSRSKSEIAEKQQIISPMAFIPHLILARLELEGVFII
jgi:hypothetical protein